MPMSPKEKRFHLAFFVILVSTWVLLAVMPHIVQLKPHGGLGLKGYDPVFFWLLTLMIVGFILLDAVVTAHPLLCTGRAFLLLVNQAFAHALLVEHDPLIMLFYMPLVGRVTFGSLVVSAVAMALNRNLRERRLQRQTGHAKDS